MIKSDKVSIISKLASNNSMELPHKVWIEIHKSLAYKKREMRW